MLKYLYAKEVFKEVPDEITLAIAISNCQIKCHGCNQKELWEDKGTTLDVYGLNKLINTHHGITCVCFMGSGNKEYAELNKLAKEVRSKGLKVAVYLGEDSIPTELNLKYYDFIKIGHWDLDKGGLNSPTTNQTMYHIKYLSDGTYWETNINHLFLKNNED